MPLLEKLSLRGDKRQSSQKDGSSVQVENGGTEFPLSPPVSPPGKENVAPPGYMATDTTDGPTAEDLSAAFANLSISTKGNLEFPDSNLCLAHLKLLTTFHNLKEDVGYTDGLFGLWDAPCEPIGKRDEALAKTREKRWALYIARAVDRFKEWWLKIVCEQENTTMLRQKDMQHGNLKFTDFPKRGVIHIWDAASLPPIDVLMVWHAFMLNPRNYLEDCMRFGVKDLWATGMPWHAVNSAIDTNFNYEVPEVGKQRFVTKTGLHWNNADDPLSKFLYCPRCSKALDIPWTTCGAVSRPTEKDLLEMNGTGYGDQGFSYICHKCGGEINHDLLRVHKFKRDVENLIRNDEPMGGTILPPTKGTPDGLIRATSSDPSYQNTFPNRLILSELKSKILDLISKDELTLVNMTAVKTLIENVIRDRRAIGRTNNTASIGRHSVASKPERLAIRKMMSRYWENSSIFSMELGGAVIRQSVFVDKMHDLDWLHSPAAQQTMQRLIKKYDRFIHIMKLHPQNVCVPTLDVDLAWHTHQLSPQQYYAFTMKECNKFIDHDDKIEESALSTAFEWTSKTYQRLYREAYSLCTCWYCEAIRSKHIDDSNRIFGTSKHEKVLDTFYSSGEAQFCPPSNSAHISAHSAVRVEDTSASIQESTAARLRLKHKSDLDQAYVKACNRAKSKGRKVPPRDEYYAMSWGYPYMMYGPYYAPLYVGAGPVYYAGDPCSMAMGAGMAGNCCQGTCGGGVAAGGCGGPGGCGASAAVTQPPQRPPQHLQPPINNHSRPLQHTSLNVLPFFFIIFSLFNGIIYLYS